MIARIIFLLSLITLSLCSIDASAQKVQSKTKIQKNILGHDTLLVHSYMDSVHHFLRQGRADQALLLLLQVDDMMKGMAAFSEARVRLHRGFIIAFSDLEAPHEAILHAEELVNLLLLDGDSRPLGVYLAYGQLGSYLLELGRADSALEVFQVGLPYAIDSKNKLYHSSALNNIGMALTETNNLEEASKYFKESIEMLEKVPESSALRASICDNMATLALKKGNSSKALPLYEKNYGLLKKLYLGGEPKLDKMISTGITAAELAIRLDKDDDARKLIQDMEQYILIPSDKVLRLTHLKQFWRLKRLLRLESGTPEELLQYSLKEAEITDSLQAATKRNHIRTVDVLNRYRLLNIRQHAQVNKLKLDQKENQLQLVQQKASLNQFWLWVALTGSLLIILGIIFYYNRRTTLTDMKSKLTSLELRNKELEKEQLSKELEGRKKDLTDVALDNTRKVAWMEDLRRRLNYMRTMDQEERDIAIRQLTMNLNTQIALEQRQKIFQENVDQINQEFYGKLTRNFPGLTKSERELCGFIRVRMSGKEIANLRKVEPKSVTKAKGRLRKKLGLDPYEDLYLFFEKF